ncbi:hypothetical protein CLV48_102392 [Cecembia rubra]|uniref:Uncharacterized protein n=1 Tax=Cecembia rubra TaxID=1485585 RepID=A0A2P8EAU2_9BACT|nr:hypothetical protein CLV48_102392 [Cecembia rubra]
MGVLICCFLRFSCSFLEIWVPEQLIFYPKMSIYLSIYLSIYSNCFHFNGSENSFTYLLSLVLGSDVAGD